MARLLRHARLVTMTGLPAGYDMIGDGAIAIDGESIVWCGESDAVQAQYRDWPVEDLEGRLVTPALIDCHSHIVHAGERSHEFALRLAGASYAEIASAAGGILATVRDTRAASEEALLASALPRVDALIGEGTATLEVKSGYGLDSETELKMLRVARRIATVRDIDIRTTLLAAHAVPEEYSGRADAYIDEVCIPLLGEAASLGLVDAVDAFCEHIAFSPAQIARLFDAATELGLPVKLHAEQLSNSGGARLAARYRALSADHLEYALEEDAAAMAAAGTVAVLLPGAWYTLRETQLPPVEQFRLYGVPMAVATDCNPGTSPLSSLLVAMNMACTLFRLTPVEALAGVTVNAAAALGLTDRGRIAPGMRADLAIWEAARPEELSYRIGFNSLHSRIRAGQ